MAQKQSKARSEVNGKLAAAHALMEAGNVRQAMVLAAEVLAQVPHEGGAIDVLCEGHFKNFEAEIETQLARSWIGYLLRNGNGRSVELKSIITLAQDWIGHSPEDLRPYRWLIKAFRKQHKRRPAKAVLQTFKNANPHDSLSLSLLQADLDLNYGAEQKANAWWVEVYEQRGDHVKAKELRAEVLFEKGHINAAEAELESLSEEVPGIEDAQVKLATIYLRHLKLSKCRLLCRHIAMQFPENLAAKELQILSWLILFPPFLLCALAIRIFLTAYEVSQRWKEPYRLGATVLWYIAAIHGLLAAGLCFGAFTKLLHMSKQPAALSFTATGLSTALFFFYCQNPGLISFLWSLRHKRAVKLRDY